MAGRRPVWCWSAIHCTRRADLTGPGQPILPSVHVPCLFVSGTKDAFAAPAELQGATAVIPETVSHVWLQGADHGLRRQDGPVAEAVSAWMAHLVAKF